MITRQRLPSRLRMCGRVDVWTYGRGRREGPRAKGEEGRFFLYPLRSWHFSLPHNRRPYVHTFILPYVFLLLLLVAGPAAAQTTGADPVQRNAQADIDFEAALQAFEAENYALAYQTFRAVYERYPLHRKTTAAMVMAGKALYRNREYARAVELLTQFREDFPTSGYRATAGRTLGFAQQKAQEEELRANAIRLGIALPLNREDRVLTQSLFTGMRIAVDEYNTRALRPITMVFRDSRNTQAGAQQAVEVLAEEDVDVIVGPLYSGEAQAAAGTAEGQGIVLIAPLATDEGVARGRRYVFQANPTISERGAFMARMAIDSLGLRRVGVAAEKDNTISERMAEGFHQEALRLGADVMFYELLASSRDWTQLPDLVGNDALSSVEAVYLPIHRDRDRDAHRIMEETLTSLSRLPSPPRVLGGSKWHGVSFAGQARSLNVTYSDVYYVDDGQSEVRTFKRKYREVSGGQQPGRLAYVGYDVASYLIIHLAQQMGQPLPDLMRASGVYRGLGTRIKFSQGGGSNEALFLLGYTSAGIELLR